MTHSLRSLAATKMAAQPCEFRVFDYTRIDRPDAPP